MHIVCAKGYEKLLDHYLEKLPKEVLERLLQQKTFARYDGLTVRTESFFNTACAKHTRIATNVRSP